MARDIWASGSPRREDRCETRPDSRAVPDHVEKRRSGEKHVQEELERLRQAIDGIDTNLLNLLNARMELALQVGRLKAEKSLPLFHPEREEIIFDRLNRLNPGPLSEYSLRSIYREIFSASRILQVPLRVAFLGPEWTYSHLAALSLYGHAAQYVPCPTIEDVFDALTKSKVDTAVIPIENSLQGGIGLSMDLLYEKEVNVVGECYLEIAHYLCGRAKSIDDVQRLYAHPQTLEQSRRWLMEKLKHAEQHECASTSGAALLARKDPAGAAICNLYAARHYGLPILAERIEDHAGNTTRFLALADHHNPKTGKDKTSVLFAVADQPGALFSALKPFSRKAVNMSRIESRPNRMMRWQYLFYVDFEGHADDEEVKEALAELKNHVSFLKILGSYPQKDPMHPIRPEKERVRGLDSINADAKIG